MVNTGRWPVPIAASALLTILSPYPLTAETISGTMTVGATVEDFCRIDTQPMVFGTLRETHGAHEAQSSLTLDCTPATSYLVTMDSGRHGTTATRRMADSSGTQFLAYDIFTDPARTRRWGAAASALGAVAPEDGRVELAVYGRLAGATTLAGKYRDTVTITVEF